MKLIIQRRPARRIVARMYQWPETSVGDLDYNMGDQ